MKRPFFSIAIPTYNRAEKLKITLSYLLTQNFGDFEIVISDNASTDNTQKIVKYLNSQRIKYFRNKTNIDVLPNVKKAIGYCRGEYIFLEGDDDYLVHPKTLSEIKKIIKKTNAGYVRINYLSLSPDEKHIFDFRASKFYKKDTYLKPSSDAKEIIDFLLKADCSFLSGIVFKNNLPKNVNIIDSQLYSWFPIIYYCAKKWGAYYIDNPYIIAGWSTWRMRKDNFHPLFSLIKGKLTSEKYFNFVAGKLRKKEYSIFLRHHLRQIYEAQFPAVKFFTGNMNTLRLAKRMKTMIPDFEKDFSFNLKLFLALITPRFLLGIVRQAYLYLYIRSAIDKRYKADIIQKKSD